MRQPNFNNLLKVLKGQVPERPTLFEFFMDDEIYEYFAGEKFTEDMGIMERSRIIIKAFQNAGYDYATIYGSDFDIMYKYFKKSSENKTISINEGHYIWDEESFARFEWPEPEEFDYSHLEKLTEYLPQGMKLNICSHCGILEIVIELIGYENLCIMIYDNPELVKKVFDEVGSRYVRYYKICSKYDAVGCLMCNDDWGFNTQTMISPDDMRGFLFPWYVKIVDVVHKFGKPIILHSCGNFKKIMQDLINIMKFDAKHSYQDVIIPVEEFYEKWSDKISVLGGFDVEYLCSSTADEVYKRAKSMLERTSKKGGYAIGTGNSVAKYIPMENYLAMTKAFLECDEINK